MNQPGTSTGSIAVTAGAQKVTGAGVVTFAAINGGSAAGTLSVYDGNSTSGLLLFTIQAAISATQPAPIPQGVCFNTGLFVVVSGTGSTGVIHYRLN